MSLLGLSAAMLISSVSSATAAVTPEAVEYFNVTKYYEAFPWLGLVSNEVKYGPVTVSNVELHDGDKLVVAAPGQELKGSLHYKFDSDNKLFHHSHLVVGIKGIGSQECVADTFNLWDSSGKSSFTLIAPVKPGVYEVRFMYTENTSCQEALELWDPLVMETSMHATIGVIVVE